MIEEKTIEGILQTLKERMGFFVVNVSVDRKNKIRVLIDKPGGIRVDDCVLVSREIESMLDREEEDFELEVSSPGLNQPFRVQEQYNKNLGRKVEVVLHDGEKYQGVLTDVTGEDIELETENRVNVPGKKKKATEMKKIRMRYDDIKTTRIVINFK
ncbi:MAG: ribosome assembly cofactor RimP [Bacteroidales bacterium]